MTKQQKIAAAVVVVLAVGVGVATYIAADNRMKPAPTDVKIAAVSDDLITPQPPPTPIPEPINSCRNSLTVSEANDAPSGTVAAGSDQLIGKFSIASTQDRCATTASVPVRSVTLSFDWSGLEGQAARRAAVRNIIIKDENGTNVHAGSGWWASPARREITVPLRTPLQLVAGLERTLSVRADTRSAFGGQATPVKLRIAMARLNADLPYSIIIGSAEFGTAVVAPRLFVLVDANSPSGVQTTGMMKKVASFIITVPQETGQGILIDRAKFRFNTTGTIAPSNIRMRSPDSRFNELGPVQLVNGEATLNRPANGQPPFIAEGQTLLIDVFADTTNAQDGNGLQISFSGLWVQGETTATHYPDNVIAQPVSAPAIIY
ncbi:MAG: hypothetical protein V1723_04910 [Candidatus Uhrbacteria bacterium]